MTRTLLAATKLVDELLTAGVPLGWSVAAELGVDSIDKTQYVTHDVSSDGEANNGPGLYEVTLTVNLYDKAATLLASCDTLDAVIQGWTLGGGVIPGVGVIHSVDDISLLTPARGSAMLGKGIRQATGIYALTITNH